MSAVRFLLLLLCLSLSPHSSRSITEAEALLTFKKSLKDPSQKLSSWRPDSRPCEDKWEGIFCEEGKPVVHRIHLQMLGLSGDVDISALTQIKNLLTLSLSNNSFSGPLPPFNKLKSLRGLYASHNQFSGEIPTDYFDGTMLRRIWLSDNQFIGHIPESLGKLPTLSALHLEQNKFSGIIPDISQKSLVELDMSYNQLEGEVPASMERFGADTFQGNPGVCGKFMGTGCKAKVAEDAPKPKPNTKTTVGVMMAVVVIMTLLLLLTILMKTKDDDVDEEYNGFDKEPADHVVEVQVQGSGMQGGGLGGSERKSSAHGGGAVGGSSRRSTDSSTHAKKGSEYGSKKGGPQSAKNGIGDLVVINTERGIFGLADLMKAAAEVLGNGGLGSAYKAVMSNGVSVVVKRIRDMNKLGREDFDVEIRRIGKLRHKNILTPLAYHYRVEEKLVVSEYIPKGSLLYVLHGDRGIYHAELNWPTRLKIIQGVASGLQYLYAEFPSYELPHGNLKSSNVLLNDAYEPLLSDYAFIQMVTLNQAAQGMFSFKAPEAVEHQHISSKCDVYCLGIIILEVLTGKFPSQYLSAGKGGTDVVQWVRSSIEEKNEAEFLDPEMTSNGSIEAMVRLLHIGAACTDNDPIRRPTMEEAISKIEGMQP